MSLEFKNIMLANYKIIKIIGKGTFSTVKLALDRETGEKIAIKILEKNKIKNKRDFIRIEREINMVKNINHPNIAQVLDIKEDEDKYYIMMEYCQNGELFNLILEKRKLNEEESSYFYYQLINGLEYIHINNIIHRDLKPENLLLTKDNILKIIDFGLSNYNTNDNLLSTPCGSPCYASPEMVSGKKYNGFTSDVWSTGIILYAMIYGYLPFENINNNNDLLFKKISECKVDYPRNSCIFALDLLKKILVPNPNERYKISDIKKHKFYLKGKSIFHHKHKGLNIYQIYDNRKVNISDNNNRKFSKEKKLNIYNFEKFNTKENKRFDFENCYIIDNDNYNRNFIDTTNNQIIVNNEENIPKYKNNQKKFSQSKLEENIYNIPNKKILNSFHKPLNEEKKQRMIDIENNYFSNLDYKDHKRNTHFINLNSNTETKNNLFRNINNFSIAPSIKIDKEKNSDIYKLEEEQKNKSKVIKKNRDNEHNLILTNFMTNQKYSNNKERNKNIQIEILPISQSRTSESKIYNNVDKFANLNSFDENENNFIYQDLSNIKKMSPLNEHNNKKIVINLKNGDIKNNITKKKESGDIMIIIKNENVNVNNYINRTENNFNKKNNNKTNTYRDRNKEETKDEKKMIKKYSISVQKNKNIENKSKSLLKARNTKRLNEVNIKNIEKLNKIEEYNDHNKKGSFEGEKKIKSNIIKNNDIKKELNCKLKESKHISLINYIPNNTMLIDNFSPDKKELDFEFLKKNKIDKKKYEKNISQNLSFNQEFIHNEKNYSLIKNNKNVTGLNIKNEKHIINNGTNNHLTRNSNEIRSEFNDNIIFSSSNRLSQINNKSLENNYLKKKNQSKEDKERKNHNYFENYEKISEVNNKRVDKNKRNISNNYNNNYIKIISNSKREIDTKKLQKKSNNSIHHELIENNTLNLNNDTINYHSKNKDMRNNEKEEYKYYKDKKGNLRLTIYKIDNNKLTDEYLTKINYSNKENNANKEYYVKYELNGRKGNFYNTERNDRNNSNNQKYSYIRRSLHENKNLSNKCINNKKETNNYRFKLSDGKKIEEFNSNNSYEKNKNIDNKINKWNISTNNIINNINKINISNLPSITIDMNILNKNNSKYLKYYDSIKNKL